MKSKAVWLCSLNSVGVKGAGDSEAVEPLHGGDGWGDWLWGSKGMGPHVPWRQVAVLLQPWLQSETKRRQQRGSWVTLQHATKENPVAVEKRKKTRLRLKHPQKHVIPQLRLLIKVRTSIKKLFGLILIMTYRDYKFRMFLGDCSKNTFLPDSENKFLNIAVLCFDIWIFGQSEQNYFKPLARLHVMTKHKSYSTIIQLSTEDCSAWKLKST